MDQFVHQAVEMLRRLNLPVLRNLVKDKNGGRERFRAPSVTVKYEKDSAR
jgi:hypothetical protein